jgi:hypothetical protein
MKSAETLMFVGKFLATIAILASIGICPVPAEAQAGNNAICNSVSGCTTAPTPAFIDASALGNNRTDLCSVLYKILTSASTTYPAAGAVIDARGFPGTQGASMVCANGTTPWFNGTAFANVPSTILLPAGIITIPSTWVLPGETKLIGEGSEIQSFPVSSPVPGITDYSGLHNHYLR